MSGIVQYAQGEDLLLRASALQVHIPAKERKMIIASGKKAVRDYPHKELAQEIGSLLVGLFRDLGIHGQPDAFDGARFTQSLVDHFPELTLTDVKVAFEMHVMGDLADYVASDLKHFQQFSFSYYATILKGYQQKRREVMHNINGRVQLSSLNKGRNEQQQAGHGTLMLLRQLHELSHLYLMGGKDQFIIHDAMIRILIATGVMEKIPVPSDSDRQEAVSKSSLRVDSAVGAGYRAALESGNLPSDIERRATVAATRRYLLARLTELGIDKLDELFADAEQRCKDRYNLHGQ